MQTWFPSKRAFWVNQSSLQCKKKRRKNNWEYPCLARGGILFLRSSGSILFAPYLILVRKRTPNLSLILVRKANMLSLINLGSYEHYIIENAWNSETLRDGALKLISMIDNTDWIWAKNKKQPFISKVMPYPFQNSIVSPLFWKRGTLRALP